MLLSARFLVDVGGVNSYREVSTIRMTEGDTLDVYLQLRDVSVNLATEGFVPPGRRYVPTAPSALQVYVENLDTTKKSVKICTQPYATDPSIWKFTILPTDEVKGTCVLKLILTEGTKVTRGMVQPAILVNDLSGLSN